MRKWVRYGRRLRLPPTNRAHANRLPRPRRPRPAHRNHRADVTRHRRRCRTRGWPRPNASQPAAASRARSPLHRTVVVQDRPGRHAGGMPDREDFLAWIHGALHEAERALHNGDPGPRRALWSRNEPVSVLGAWRNAVGLRQVDELFTFLGESFSNCTSFATEILAYDVIGDMAYTAGLERTSASVDGQPRTYTLRATQVYRR